MTIQELEQMIALYGKEVYSFCLHLTGNRMMADELYQETFLKATETARKIRTDGNLKSYFLSVALRLWRNQKRKYAWRNRIAPMQGLSEDVRESEVGTQEDLLEDCLKREREQMVRKAVSRLEEKYKIPVLLYYMERMSVAEVASAMGIPQGTVWCRVDGGKQWNNGCIPLLVCERWCNL